MTIKMKTAGRKTWRTPEKLFNKLNAEFEFTVDACAENGNSMLPKSWEGANGLCYNWKNERVFVNPPYGQHELKLWVAKAYWESRSNGAVVVMLLPARTDAMWFHEYAMRGEIRFIRGRLRFQGAEYNAPFPSIVLIFGGKQVMDYSIASLTRSISNAR